jgi:hypothetical protein
MTPASRFTPLARNAGRIGRAAFALGVLWVGAGCSDSAADSVTKAGDLGRGRFKYTCVSDFGDDSACTSGSKDTFTFPSSIAVGGSFKLSYEPDNDTRSQIGNPVLKPAASEFLSDQSPGLFLAKSAGRVAVIARSSTNGKAVDLTYLRIAEPNEVRLRTADGKAALPAIARPPNDPEKLTLRAEAYSGGSGTAKDILAGTIDFVWTTDKPDVVGFDGAAPGTLTENGSRMTFAVGAAGTATLTATVGDKSATMTVTVTP